MDLIQLKFEIYFIQGDKKKGSDISVLLLPSGNGEKKKLAACIWSSLRVKYGSPSDADIT